MNESSIFDEIPEEISAHLVSFSEAINEVEGLVNQVSEIRKTMKETNKLDDIKCELSLCYTLNALFFVYLKCNGIETSSHPIMQELDRVMTALKRCRSLAEKTNSQRMVLDKEASTRFVKHALWQSAHSKSKKRRSDPDGAKSK